MTAEDRAAHVEREAVAKAAERIAAYLDASLADFEKASGKNYLIERVEIPDGPALWTADLYAVLAALPQTGEAAAVARVEALTFASDDGTEYEHNGHAASDGEPECPRCWAESIRAALTAGADQ